jgi:hypothetical protein
MKVNQRIVGAALCTVLLGVYAAVRQPVTARHSGTLPESKPKPELFVQVLSELEKLTALSANQDKELAALAALEAQLLQNAALGRVSTAHVTGVPSVTGVPKGALHFEQTKGAVANQGPQAPSRTGYPAANDPSKVCTDIIASAGSIANQTDVYQCKQTDLVLVHIPKTGGTSIEQAALKSKSRLLWGFQYDHARFRQKRRGLPKVESLIPLCVGNFGMKCCSWWHIPPRYVNEWRPYYSAQHRFCAVRDPYARALSEYSFRGGKTTRKLKCDQLNKTEVNTWLRGRLQAQLEGANTLDDCHWYPQYQYIEPNVGVRGLPPPPPAAPGNLYIDAGLDGRSCNTVMRMESLTTDFVEVMAEFGHPEVKLPKSKSFSSGCKDLNMLDPETRALIASMYHQDFVQFGYPK